MGEQQQIQNFRSLLSSQKQFNFNCLTDTYADTFGKRPSFFGHSSFKQWILKAFPEAVFFKENRIDWISLPVSTSTLQEQRLKTLIQQHPEGIAFAVLESEYKRLYGSITYSGTFQSYLEKAIPGIIVLNEQLPLNSKTQSTTNLTSEQQTIQNFRTLFSLHPEGIHISGLLDIYIKRFGFRPSYAGYFKEWLIKSLPEIEILPGKPGSGGMAKIRQNKSPNVPLIPPPTTTTPPPPKTTITPLPPPPPPTTTKTTTPTNTSLLPPPSTLTPTAPPIPKTQEGCLKMILYQNPQGIEISALQEQYAKTYGTIILDGNFEDYLLAIPEIVIATDIITRTKVVYLNYLMPSYSNSPSPSITPPLTTPNSLQQQTQISTTTTTTTTPVSISSTRQQQIQQPPPTIDSFEGNQKCPRNLLGVDLYLSFNQNGAPIFSKSKPPEAEKFIPFNFNELEVIGKDSLSTMISILPTLIRESPITVIPAWQIEEIVLDIGRVPEMHLSEGPPIELLDIPVGKSMISEGLLLLRQCTGKEIPKEPHNNINLAEDLFTSDNRLGIPNTLHRVSCVRFVNGEVIGLVYRVGKHLPGAVSIIKDLLSECCTKRESRNPPKSLLVLGRPGSGKTTLLREASRYLADELKQRVVIIDTSAEIAGGGIVAHHCIGRCRRLFVPERPKQYMVMIEAVQNHSPEVVVIDEMGDSKEVEAARTISQRGISLLGTTHGSDLQTVLKNPVCRPLVGGIQVVILSDMRAKNTDQKLKTQRAGAPCFEMVILVQGHNDFIIYPNTSDVIDSMLQNKPNIVQRRWFDKDTGLMRASFVTLENKEKFNA